MKKYVIVFTVFAALIVLASACSNSSKQNAGESSSPTPASSSSTATQSPAASASGAPSPTPDLRGNYDPFSQTVTVSVPIYKNTVDKLADGETYLDNPYLDLLEKTLNIKEVAKWTATGDAYGEKLNLMISSNDLADVFELAPAAQMLDPLGTVKKMASEGMLAPLDDAIKSYLAPDMQQALEERDNGTLKKMITYDGHIYGLPATGDISSTTPMIWVRQDWLDKLHLPAPKTMDDLIAVAKAFVNDDPDGDNKKDTYGFGMMEAFLSSAPMSALPVLFSENASTGWIKGPDGTVVYGPIQPEMKNALQILANMYAEGLIDPEFPTRGGNEYVPMLAASKLGLMEGPWYAPWYPIGKAMTATPDTEWKAYIIPNAEGHYPNEIADTPTHFLVSRKGFEQGPELIMKYANFSHAQDQYLLETTPKPREIQNDPKYKGTTTNLYNISLSGSLFNIGPNDSFLTDLKKTLDAVDKGDPTGLDPADKNTYDTVTEVKNNATPKADSNYSTYVAYNEAARQLVDNMDNIQYNYDVFSGTTPTMASRWTDLQTGMYQAFYKIIQGNEPISYFDTWVKQWNAQGGEQITREVNDAAKALGAI